MAARSFEIGRIERIADGGIFPYLLTVSRCDVPRCNQALYTKLVKLAFQVRSQEEYLLTIH